MCSKKEMEAALWMTTSTSARSPFQVSSAQAAVQSVHIPLHHDQLSQNSLQRVLAAGVLPEERPASEQGLQARLACTIS